MAYKDSKNKKTVKFPLVGASTMRGSPVEKDQRYVNVLIDTIDNKLSQAQQYYARKRPGLHFHSNPSGGTAVGRGIYSWRGDLYSVFGNKVYKNSSALTGTLLTTTGICDFVETSQTAGTPYLCINDGQNLWIINAAGTMTMVVSNFPTTLQTGQIIFFDGYLLTAQTNGRIWNSNVEDPTTWGALDYLVAEAFPDDLVAIARQNNVAVAFGKWSTEFFYDAGNAAPGSFMQRLDQAALQIGATSADAVMQHENLIIWVARAQTGGYTVQALDGYTKLDRVSNDILENLMALEDTEIENCYAFAVRLGGHFCYILNLTGCQRTFVYDIEDKHWTEFAYAGGPFNFVWGIQHNDGAIIQHATNGNLYHFHPDVYQDDGVPIDVLIQTIRYDADTQYRKFCSRFELVGDRQTDPSPVLVQYTDDDYNNFTSGKIVDMANRPFITRMGNFRRRAWLLTHSSNTPLRLEAIELDVQLGEQ